MAVRPRVEEGGVVGELPVQVGEGGRVIGDNVVGGRRNKMGWGGEGKFLAFQERVR